MPHLLPAAASAIAAAAPAAAAGAAKATIMTTLKSVAFKALTNLAISAALSVFSPTVGASARTVEFVIDPDGPIPFAGGHVGVPGAMAHKDTFGPDLMYYGIPVILSGAGPITAIQSVKADDYPMAFDANGGATTEPYRQEFFFRSVLGHQPAPVALSLPNGLKGGGRQFSWSAAHKLSGKAAFLMVMAENSKGSAFPNGEVKPLVEFLGLKGWDPTLDSTYPGGNGPCRLHDSSTWVTLTCPILWALKWELGLWEGPTLKGAPAHGSTTDHQVGGVGARLSGIDVPAFVAASNIAKANGWTVSAYPNTDDDKFQVLETFLQAGGAIYSQRAGKISCISRAAPRASLVTISAADTAGPLEIDTAASRIDRINTIRPRFWSPAHRWQMTAMDGEITAASYRAEDGGRTRSRGVDYPFVSNAKQAGQLAALQIANTREGIAGVIPLKPHLQRIRPGDAFTITEAGFVLNGLKCLCLNTDYDPATGVVRVSFVSETDAKYPFALGQNPTPPTPQVLTPVDPRFVSPPVAGDWTVTPRPPVPGGGQLPGFDLTGVVSNDMATAIIVEHGPTDDGPWKQAYEGPPTVTNIPIDGLQSGAIYYIAIQYRRGNNYSDRHVYGPHTAPVLDPGPNAPSLAAVRASIEAAFGDIFDVSELLGEARDLIDAQGVEIAAARGGLPSLGARVAQLAQATFDGDEANALLISSLTTRTDNAAADIIDLENALATETGARAEAIQQVVARSSHRANLIDDPSGAGGFRSWIKEGGPNTDTINDPAVGRIFVVGDYMASRVYPASAGQKHSLGYNASPVGGGHVRLQYLTSGGTVEGIRVDNTLGTQAERRRSAAPSTAPAGTTGFRLLAVPPSGGVLPVWAIKVNFGDVATDFTDDYSAAVIEASVTEQALAIVDLENNAAIAAWRVKAEASGARPAIIEAVSSTLGSYLAFSAAQIWFGENTAFIDDLDIWITTVGANVRIMGFGAPFGQANNLMEWWGPAGVPIGSMTTANGIDGRMTTAPGYFNNVFSSQASALRSSVAVNSGAGTTNDTNWTTWGTATYSNLPLGGLFKLFAEARPNSGMTIGGPLGSTFEGEYRVVQSGTTIASGPVTAYVGGGDADVSVDMPATPKAPAATGETSLVLQVRRASGSAYIDGAGATVTFYAEWTKAG